MNLLVPKPLKNKWASQAAEKVSVVADKRPSGAKARLTLNVLQHG
jgi:hypothetical protein